LTEPLIHLVCGATGAGKTTYAIKLAGEIGAMRYSIDEWMTTLYWMDSPDPIEYDWAMERIGRCEQQIWSLALAQAQIDKPSVLDLGLTKKSHRAKFAALADESSLAFQLHFLDLPAEERWERVAERNREKGETYRLDVSRENFDFVEGLWERPGAEEIRALNGIRIAD